MYRFIRLVNKAREFYSCLRAGERAHNYPEVILVELTSRCNLNCGICIRQRIIKRYNADMSFEKFKNITKDMLPFLNKITFAGFGEPLLNKDIFKIIDYVHAKKIMSCLITNGTLLTSEVCQKLIEAGLNKISISLDSTREERYRKFRGFELQKILMNIRVLKEVSEKYRGNGKHDLKILVNNTLTAENVREIPDMVKLAYNLKVDGLEFAVVDEVGLNFSEDPFQKYGSDKLDALLKRGIKLDRNNISNLKLFREGLMSRPAYDIPGNKACYSPWGYMLIMADGETMPCCRPFNYYLGKLDGNNFQEIWNGPGYRDFRRNLVMERYCRKCSLNAKLNNLKLYILIKSMCKRFSVMKMFSKRKF